MDCATVEAVIHFLQKFMEHATTMVWLKVRFCDAQFYSEPGHHVQCLDKARLLDIDKKQHIIFFRGVCIPIHTS